MGEEEGEEGEEEGEGEGEVWKPETADCRVCLSVTDVDNNDQ